MAFFGVSGPRAEFGSGVRVSRGNREVGKVKLRSADGVSHIKRDLGDYSRGRHIPQS